MAKRFKIKLKQFHDKTGLTGYAVSKETGVAENTARKYIEKDVVASTVPMTVVLLCDFYGVDWRDPEVIEVIEEESEGSDASPDRKTPLPASA